MNQTLTLPLPDDWHLHLRDGDMLAGVAPDTARHFGRAIIMPNLVPPVTTSALAQDYHARIMKAVPGSDFQPLMTLYLTENTDPNDVAQGFQSGVITAVKLYPAGATTNSASGVRDITKVYPVLERMAEIGCPLLIHGEVTDHNVDIFDREARFIETVLDPLRRRIPELRVVMEHITTADAVAYARGADENLGATITVHHLIIDRNHLLAGGIRPHYYCLPVAKRATHRDALIDAATSGEKRFFFGSDSAPHVDAAKETSCGCAGIYTAPVALACLAHVFEQAGALDKLAGFVSRNGPEFYRMPVNSGKVVLRKGAAYARDEHRETGDGPVTVFDPGFELEWSVERIA